MESVTEKPQLYNFLLTTPDPPTHDICQASRNEPWVPLRGLSAAAAEIGAKVAVSLSWPVGGLLPGENDMESSTNGA